ncbi:MULTISPECIES: hypothetical protein [Streptomyces]|uniref:Uncharacterized protein n=1 Tax=Streptomyces yunnanensis TaxID=156453 RepID=A0ABY8AMK6_9ACTN|nr:MULTISPECIES: hypothetical protein [Streptomyces]AJC55340.1 hypothetical protein GZL_02751 [Streptomyces sp. 769]WEB46128.1 hypothetical protein MOV08_11595 [Streptomyces yunnanensis]
MRKLRKAAVMVAVLGSVGLLGAGTASANAGPGGGHRQLQPSQQTAIRTLPGQQVIIRQQPQVIIRQQPIRQYTAPQQPRRQIVVRHQPVRQNIVRQQPIRQPVVRQQSNGRRGSSHGHKIVIRQFTSCRTFDKNVDVLGGVGVANGWFGSWHRWFDRRGVEHTRIGTTVGCNNVVRF